MLLGLTSSPFEMQFFYSADHTHLLYARLCFEVKKKLGGNDSLLENRVEKKAVWSLPSFGTLHISDCTLPSGFLQRLYFNHSLSKCGFESSFYVFVTEKIGARTALPLLPREWVDMRLYSSEWPPSAKPNRRCSAFCAHRDPAATLGGNFPTRWLIR